MTRRLVLSQPFIGGWLGRLARDSHGRDARATLHFMADRAPGYLGLPGSVAPMPCDCASMSAADPAVDTLAVTTDTGIAATNRHPMVRRADAAMTDADATVRDPHAVANNAVTAHDAAVVPDRSHAHPNPSAHAHAVAS